MRIFPVLMATALLCLSNISMADNNTRDSTNAYSPANQDTEKMQQKPSAQDEGNSDKSYNDQNTTHKKRMWHRKSDSSTSTTTGSSPSDSSPSDTYNR